MTEFAELAPAPPVPLFELEQATGMAKTNPRNVRLFTMTSGSFDRAACFYGQSASRDIAR